MQTARGKHLGAEIRSLREAAGVKQDAACTRLGWSRSKLDRIEAGTNIPKLGDLVAALDLYNADADTRGALKDLRDEAKAGRRGWWMGFGGVFNGPLPSLESSATMVRCFETNLIPGLAQTPDYARAVISAARPEDGPDSIDTRMRARMARQAAVFERPNPPDVQFIVDEVALLRPVGGRKVLSDQISALWSLSRRPNVTVQIVPLEAGAHVAMEGPFMILNFGVAAYPEVAFTVGQAGDVYLEGEADLRRLGRAWDRLSMAALSPEDSARRCAELTRE
jgi:transcriptional regulator with XRE-family HTH domain